MKWILTLLASVSVALASYIIVVDPATGRITGEIRSADSLKFQGVPGHLINPTIPAGLTRTNWQQYYWTNGAFSPIPQAWLDAEATATAAAQAQAEADARAEQAIQRKRESVQNAAAYCSALMTLDQINLLRARAGLGLITTNQFLRAWTNAVADFIDNPK